MSVNLLSDNNNHIQQYQNTNLNNPETEFIEKIYFIENLDCANCGAKIETKLNKLTDIHFAQLTFSTKKLKIVAKNPDALLPQIQQIARSIEHDIIISTTLKKAQNITHKKQKISLIEIILGASLFGIGEFTNFIPDSYSIYLYIIAYLILGFRILKTAFINLFHGNIFDENFLMSIATLGAFMIKEYPEAIGVMLFYRIGEYFEERASHKSRSQIIDAIDLRPETVNLINSNSQNIKIIPANETKVGDILLVRVGDRIPVDGTVIEGESRLDTSPVTGEPLPLKITPNSTIISGCVNLSSTIKMRVDKPLSQSMVSRILNSVENAAANKPKIDKFITRFARIYTPIVVIIAIFTVIFPSLIIGNFEHWLYIALTFLVISCPCALVLSVPLAFFAGIGRASKLGILFKGGLSLEALNKVKAIVMDKTGTLTYGNFSVKAIYPTKNYTQNELLAFCASCEQYSTHPIATSIIHETTKYHLKKHAIYNHQEIAGEGIVAYLDKEKTQQILCGNKRLMTRFNINLPENLISHNDTEIFIALNTEYIGSIIIGDTIKNDAKATISKLKQLKLTTAMLTGDNEFSAQTVAQEIGIDKVQAKLLPEDKLANLSKLRHQYGKVFFIGDGINDAPILAGADVGAAMGSGADAAIEAADVVFLNSKVHSILQAIYIARDTINIAWQNVIFALTIKITIMVFGLLGYASMWAAVFADTGVAILCILNSIRILYKKY